MESRREGDDQLLDSICVQLLKHGVHALSERFGACRPIVQEDFERHLRVR